MPDFTDLSKWTFADLSYCNNVFGKIKKLKNTGTKVKSNNFPALWNAEVLTLVHLKVADAEDIQVVAIVFEHLRNHSKMQDLRTSRAFNNKIREWRKALNLLQPELAELATDDEKADPRTALTLVHRNNLQSNGSLELTLKHYIDKHSYFVMMPKSVNSDRDSLLQLKSGIQLSKLESRVKVSSESQPAFDSKATEGGSHKSDVVPATEFSEYGDPTCQVLKKLPETVKLVSLLENANEVFILQNRLVQIGENEQFLSAFIKLAGRNGTTPFRCTLYHPESKVAKDRAASMRAAFLGRPGRPDIDFIDDLKACLRELKRIYIAHGQHEKCEFRFVNQRIPYTVYGFGNKAYVGWLQFGRKGNEHTQFLLDGPDGVFHAVKDYFEHLWDSCKPYAIDFSKDMDTFILNINNYPGL